MFFDAEKYYLFYPFLAPAFGVTSKKSQCPIDGYEKLPLFSSEWNDLS